MAHTRPRCEKKLAAFCENEGIFHQLPLFRSPKSYRGKNLVFLKPLFPGYLFLRPAPGHIPLLRQNRYLANLLHPPDQNEFAAQLGAILLALEADREVGWPLTSSKGQRVPAVLRGLCAGWRLLRWSGAKGSLMSSFASISSPKLADGQSVRE